MGGRVVFSARLLFFSSCWLLCIASRDTVEEHLKRGNQLLATGQLLDALNAYHAAIEMDPENYQSLYRRATVYMALGKTMAALPDLNEVLRIKPDFVSARNMRGSVFMKVGDLTQARSDYQLIKEMPKSVENLELIEQLMLDVEQGRQMAEYGQCDHALQFLDRALEHMIWDSFLYSLRAECYKKTGDTRKAINDLRNLAKINADSTEIYLEIARSYYGIGDVENGLTNIRECLKLNPDHSACFSFYKKLKKMAKMREQLTASKNEGAWEECLERAEKILAAEKEEQSVRRDVYKYTCTCRRQMNQLEEAIADCTEFLKETLDATVYCERGEAHIFNEDYEKALSDFLTAKFVNSDESCGSEGVKKTEKIKKQAEKKDYYKILGVKRSANKQEITKAYRALAQQWHPDNFQDDEDKKKAQERFIDIAAAKEVLTDKGKSDSHSENTASWLKVDDRHASN